MQDLKVVVLQRTVVSRFGCFVFEIWVLRASVFVFECFVFETTPSFHGLRKERLAQWPSFWEVHVRNNLLSHLVICLLSTPLTGNVIKTTVFMAFLGESINILNHRAQKIAQKIMHRKQRFWTKGPRDTQIIDRSRWKVMNINCDLKNRVFFIACTTKRIKFSLSRGLSFSLPFWTESCALGKPDSELFWESKFHFPRVFEGVTPLTRKPKGDKIAN